MTTSHDFEIFNIESHWISKENRFDAGFYAEDVVAARVLIGELKEKGISIKTIEQCTNDVYWPGRFKRKYVSKGEGKPFLTPSEIFMLVPESRKFVIDYPDDLSVGENCILITRSGTIGRCLITNRLIKKFVLSDDLIRIVPEDDNYGYLYAYLQTWIGQTFLTKNKYGSTVKHIEPDHVEEISIPDLPEIKDELNERIKKVFQLRLEAQNLLIKADEMIYSKLELPEISEDDVEYWGDDEDYRKIKSFDIKFSELNLRFDVSYHLPILRNIKSYLNNSKYSNPKLGSVIEDIFIPNRFKRPYVKKENGIPFLQGSHISQIKPMGIKYIWKKMANVERTKLKKNWILMTRSGTVGRISFVSDLMDGWGASEHLLRLIIKENVHPGFITAFLSSDYGKHQIKGKVYGAVVDEIAEQDTSLIEDIDIILPPEDIQKEIGNLVLEAYSKKDQANLVEDEAIQYLENKLRELTE